MVQLLALLKLVKKFAEQQKAKEDKVAHMKASAEVLDSLEGGQHKNVHHPTAHDELLYRKLGQSTNSTSRAQAVQEPPLPPVVVSTGA
jgi:hypothetical protein